MKFLLNSTSWPYLLLSMLGILHSSVSQHIIGEDSKHASLEFSASPQPYITLVETFPSALAFFISLVKHL